VRAAADDSVGEGEGESVEVGLVGVRDGLGDGDVVVGDGLSVGVGVADDWVGDGVGETVAAGVLL
jgi:hypothetical protein